MAKSKSIQNLENMMESIEPGTFRFEVLECAKRFKTSWMELGQHLFSVYRDKLYKEWGYLTFEAYCAKEVGIRQNTAVKLLKSYSFLEKEEPAFLKMSQNESRAPRTIPSVDAVNSLRLAKNNERISPKDYEELRADVLEEAKPEEEVRKKIRYVLKSSPKDQSAKDPVELKNILLRKMINGLNVAKRDCQELEFPQKILKQIDSLVDLLSEYQS